MKEMQRSVRKSQRVNEKSSEFCRKIFSPSMIPLSEIVLFYRGVPILDLSFTPAYVSVFVLETDTLARGQAPYRTTRMQKWDVDATEESSCFYAGRRSSYICEG